MIYPQLSRTDTPFLPMHLGWRAWLKLAFNATEPVKSMLGTLRFYLIYEDVDKAIDARSFWYGAAHDTYPLDFMDRVADSLSFIESKQADEELYNYLTAAVVNGMRIIALDDLGRSQRRDHITLPHGGNLLQRRYGVEEGSPLDVAISEQIAKNVQAIYGVEPQRRAEVINEFLIRTFDYYMVYDSKNPALQSTKTCAAYLSPCFEGIFRQMTSDERIALLTDMDRAYAKPETKLKIRQMILNAENADSAPSAHP